MLDSIYWSTVSYWDILLSPVDAWDSDIRLWALWGRGCHLLCMYSTQHNGALTQLVSRCYHNTNVKSEWKVLSPVNYLGFTCYFPWCFFSDQCKIPIRGVTGQEARVQWLGLIYGWVWGRLPSLEGHMAPWMSHIYTGSSAIRTWLHFTPGIVNGAARVPLWSY